MLELLSVKIEKQKVQRMIQIFVKTYSISIEGHVDYGPYNA